MRRLLALLPLALFFCGSPALAVSPFIVFFEPNSTRMIDPFSDTILDNAVEALRIHDVREVVVAAHADRAGSVEYNHALSRRRAGAVRAALIQRGYTGTVTIEAHGEGRPLVETENGIAHPENRRAEIVMRCFHNPESVAAFSYMRCPL